MILAATLALALAPWLAAPAAAQMSERAILQALTPMMNDPDFDEKLEDFAEEHDLDPNMLRALVAAQKARTGGAGGKPPSKQQLRKQQQQQLQQKKDDD
jgi:hypothetical protein